MNKTFSLYRLQQLDSQRLQNLKRIKQIDQIIASDKAVLRARSIVQKATDALSECDKELHDIHQKVEAKDLKLKQTQAKLFGGKVSATKELQDLQAESEALGRNLANLEEQQLALLEKHDKRQATKETAETDLQQLLNQKASENSRLLGEREKLKRQLLKVKSQREALKRQLDETVLKDYSALFKIKGGLAVAEIFEGSCKACGVQISPTDIQQAADPSVILYCKGCGRILYKL